MPVDSLITCPFCGVLVRQDSAPVVYPDNAPLHTTAMEDHQTWCPFVRTSGFRQMSRMYDRIDVPAAATILGVSPAAVYKLIERGVLFCDRKPAGKRWRYRISYAQLMPLLLRRIGTTV